MTRRKLTIPCWLASLVWAWEVGGRQVDRYYRGRVPAHLGGWSR